MSNKFFDKTKEIFSGLIIFLICLIEGFLGSVCFYFLVWLSKKIGINYTNEIINNILEYLNFAVFFVFTIAGLVKYILDAYKDIHKKVINTKREIDLAKDLSHTSVENEDKKRQEELAKKVENNSSYVDNGVEKNFGGPNNE